jgi:hypothetical protein
LLSKIACSSAPSNQKPSNSFSISKTKVQTKWFLVRCQPSAARKSFAGRFLVVSPMAALF